MPTASVQSFSAQVRSTPPREKTFSAADTAAGLRMARSWVEDQVRAFIEEHSLPHNPWEAGAVFAGEGVRGEPVAELDVYTSEGEYVFDWDDDD